MTQVEDEEEQEIKFLSEHCRPGYHRRCQETYRVSIWGEKLKWVCVCDCHVVGAVRADF